MLTDSRHFGSGPLRRRSAHGAETSYNIFPTFRHRVWHFGAKLDASAPNYNHCHFDLSVFITINLKVMWWFLTKNWTINGPCFWWLLTLTLRISSSFYCEKGINTHLFPNFTFVKNFYYTVIQYFYTVLPFYKQFFFHFSDWFNLNQKCVFNMINVL